MKGVVNIAALVTLGFQAWLYAPFQETMNFAIALPKKSLWGVFTSKTSPAQLSTSCLAGALEDATIDNNAGSAGVYVGTSKAFQLCPCLENGVTYWNPLTIVQAYDPCALAHFSPVGESFSGVCAGSEVALASGGSGMSKISASTNTYDSLLKELDKKYAYVASNNDKNYQTLYQDIKQEINFLASVSEQLKPDSSKGQDFLSVPYLRFAASYGNMFVTQAMLASSQKSLFGNSVDVSTYFPNNTFPITIDLDESQIDLSSDQIRKRQSGSMTLGGVLVRAKEDGFIKDLSAQEFLQMVGAVSPTQAQVIINKYAQATGTLADYPNIIGERALLEEIFFLQLAMMQPIRIAAGMYNPTESEIKYNLASSNADLNSTYNVGVDALINTTPFTQYTNGQAVNRRLGELYGELFSMARYVRGLNINSSDERPAYAPQPIDTFYGVIVINNGTFQGQPVDVFVPPFGTSYSNGSVGIFPANGGVDQWSVSGIDSLSGLKYRQVNFMTSASAGAVFMNGAIELQVEEGSGGSVYQSGTGSVFAPGVALFDKLNNIRTTLDQSDTIQQFFELTPSTPWAVVLELANQQGIAGTNSQPTFTILGLARLNPNMFSLSYTAADMNNIAITPFWQQSLFSARETIYTTLQSMHGTKITIGSGKQAASIPETNMNLVKFNGALAHTWGGQTSIGTALKNIESIMSNSFLTLDTTQQPGQQINSKTILNLVASADSNPDPKGMIVPVASKTFELFSVTAENDL